MLEKLQNIFWKALTPDLVPDQPDVQTKDASELSVKMIAALGGPTNFASQRRVALTRIRVQVHDTTRLDEPALWASGVAGVMVLAGGVVHLVMPQTARDSQVIR